MSISRDEEYAWRERVLERLQSLDTSASITNGLLEEIKDVLEKVFCADEEDSANTGAAHNRVATIDLANALVGGLGTPWQKAVKVKKEAQDDQEDG